MTAPDRPDDADPGEDGGDTDGTIEEPEGESPTDLIKEREPADSDATTTTQDQTNDIDGSEGGQSDDDGPNRQPLMGTITADAKEGKQLHPISLPYRIFQAGLGFLPLLIILGFLLTPIAGPIAPILAVGLGIFGFVAIVGWQIAYYRRFEYVVTESTFDIRSGVISRRHREIPYHRIQNVDISRNLVQRGLGVAQLNLETAGGRETEASLRYVGYNEAKRLQDELRAKKRRAVAREESSGPDGEDAPEIDERVLYSITPRDLTILAIASVDLRVLSILGVVLTLVSPPFLVEFLTTLPVSPVIVIVGVVLLLALFSGIVSGVNAIINTYGFTLTEWGNELRYERGLIQRYDGSIPLDKVQTLALRENVLKRLFGYSTLAIETAGYAPGRSETQIGSESAIPIARRDKTWGIARDIENFGSVELNRPPKRARTRYAVRYELVLLVLGGAMYGLTWYFNWTMYWSVLVIAILLAPLAAHYKWKHRGYQLDGKYVITRAGYWNQVTRIVPVSRIQTIIERRTLFQRRWGLGTVMIDTAGTSSLIGGDAIAYDLDRTDARDFRKDVSKRLQEILSGEYELNDPPSAPHGSFDSNRDHIDNRWAESEFVPESIEPEQDPENDDSTAAKRPGASDRASDDSADRTDSESE